MFQFLLHLVAGLDEDAVGDVEEFAEAAEVVFLVLVDPPVSKGNTPQALQNLNLLYKFTLTGSTLLAFRCCWETTLALARFLCLKDALTSPDSKHMLDFPQFSPHYKVSPRQFTFNQLWVAVWPL